MIDWSAIERRMLEHYRRNIKLPYAHTFEYGTITGRITSNRPNFKDIEPMKEQTLYLSQFLFEHSKRPNRIANGVSHSPLTDQLAEALAGNQDKVMELATLLARLHGPAFEGDVTGFVVTRDGGETPTFGALEALIKGLQDPTLDSKPIPIYEQQLMTSEGLCATVLWARAALWLEEEGNYDVGDFKEDCMVSVTGASRPGIRGEDITIEVVNGALMQVLVDEGLMDRMGELSQCLATNKDDEGWVFSSCAGCDD